MTLETTVNQVSKLKRMMFLFLDIVLLRISSWLILNIPLILHWNVIQECRRRHRPRHRRRRRRSSSSSSNFISDSTNT